MDKNSFVFYNEWEEPLSMLDSADQGRVMMAMIHYQQGIVDDLSDSPAASMAFNFIKIAMDKDRAKWEETCSRRSDAGKKAADARWEADAKRTNRIKENAKNANRINRIKENANDANDADNDNEYDNENDIKEKEIPNGISKKKSPKPVKHKHGDFKNVLLTDDEYAKLRDRYDDIDERIQRLSLYIEQVGKVYKSHYATIIAWANRDEKEGKPRGKPADGTRGDYTLEAFERRRAEHPEDEGIYEVF